MMKNSKLKFSEHMQNISRSKSVGKFVLIVIVKYLVMNNAGAYQKLFEITGDIIKQSKPLPNFSYLMCLQNDHINCYCLTFLYSSSLTLWTCQPSDTRALVHSLLCQNTWGTNPCVHLHSVMELFTIIVKFFIEANVSLLFFVSLLFLTYSMIVAMEP